MAPNVNTADDDGLGSARGEELLALATLLALAGLLLSWLGQGGGR